MIGSRAIHLLLVALLGFLSAPAHAQELGRIEGRQASPQGYYINAVPGLPTTRLSVWGYVARPGVYEVGSDFDLSTVLSLAGGPSPLATGEQNLELELRVFRDAREIYAAPVDQLALGTETLPQIQDGDIVELVPDRTIRVNVWGTVRDPGLKTIGPSDTIRSVLSQAGGPTLGAIRGNTSREVTLRVTRAATGDVVYDGPLEDLPAAANQTQLADGDVLAVEVRERDGWETRDTLTVVGVVLSAALTATQVVRLLDGN